MNELEFEILGIKLKYKFKAQKYDCNHLIVVFSGFGSSSEFTYDFENLLQISYASVLWIKDDFDGHCCYYLCQNMNFIIEKSVISFINKKLSELQLTKKQCSVIGFSKGGSAALYYGIKYDFNNILITVPQTFIGSYVDKNWKVVAKHMMGENYSSKQVEILNSLILDLLKSDKKKEKNIYLITSKKDIQYDTEIVPIKDELFKYYNMNFLLSESIFVRAHNQVTSHHAQFILGILFILTNNIAPHLGYKILEGKKQTEIKDQSHLPVVKIEFIKLVNNLFFIGGIALLRGIEFNEFTDVDYVLRFINVSTKKFTDLRIAKAHRPDLTKQYYNGDFVIYDKAWLTTFKHAGLSLNELEKGTYEIYLLIYAVKYDIMKSVPLLFDKALNLQSSFNSKTYSISNIEEKVILTII